MSILNLYQFKMIMSYDENHISHHQNDTEKVKLKKVGNGNTLSKSICFVQTASLLSDQRYEHLVEYTTELKLSSSVFFLNSREIFKNVSIKNDKKSKCRFWFENSEENITFKIKSNESD